MPAPSTRHRAIGRTQCHAHAHRIVHSHSPPTAQTRSTDGYVIRHAHNATRTEPSRPQLRLAASGAVRRARVRTQVHRTHAGHRRTAAAARAVCGADCAAAVRSAPTPVSASMFVTADTR
eukprot:scaffold35875_cov112-Isochrysis_galbana.AAC.5